MVTANPGLSLFPFARVRPRFAVGIPNGAIEVGADVGLLAAPLPNDPLRLDPSILAPWVRAWAGVEGSPRKGLRLSVQGGVDAIGDDSQGVGGLVTPYVMGGGRARVTYAAWMGSGLPLPKGEDFIVGDPEGPAPISPRLAPVLLLFADANPTGGVYLDAWTDLHGGSAGGAPFAGSGIWPVVPRARAEIVASAPLPVPLPAPFPVLGALEFQGIVGVVPTDAPPALELAYPGALTRDPRVFRGETLLKMRFALRMPIAPPPPPAPGFLIFGVPTLQLDLGLGDTWGYRFDAVTGETVRRDVGPGTADTAGAAGEIGVEFRLPMAWFNLGWTLWVRGEVGLRAGDLGQVSQFLAPGTPWIGERGVRAPLGFALGLGVPIR